MATKRTRAKKVQEAPQVNIGAEIFASLRDLEKVKGIPVALTSIVFPQSH